MSTIVSFNGCKYDAEDLCCMYWCLSKIRRGMTGWPIQTGWCSLSPARSHERQSKLRRKHGNLYLSTCITVDSREMQLLPEFSWLRQFSGANVLIHLGYKLNW